MIARNCPSCGQPMPIRRLGVEVTQTKAMIFDALKTAGPAGIAWDGLWQQFREWPPESIYKHARVRRGRKHRDVQRTTLKAHVHQLSNKLEDVGWKISGSGGVYRLVKVGHLTQTG